MSTRELDPFAVAAMRYAETNSYEDFYFLIATRPPYDLALFGPTDRNPKGWIESMTSFGYEIRDLSQLNRGRAVRPEDV